MALTLGSVTVQDNGTVVKTGECDVVYSLLEADSHVAIASFPGHALPTGPVSVARTRAQARLSTTIATYIYDLLTTRAPGGLPASGTGVGAPDAFALIKIEPATALLIMVSVAGTRTDTGGSGRVAIFKKSVAIDNLSPPAAIIGTEITDMSRRGSQMGAATCSLSIDVGANRLRVDASGPNGSTVAWTFAFQIGVEVV